MRLLLLILFAATTPLLAQPLTDEQILNQLDDASAAQVRWLLDTNSFVTSAIGIAGEETLPGLTYQRLVDAKETKAFELLVQAERPVQRAYGIAGLSATKPELLTTFIESIVIDTRSIYTQSGCCGYYTSPAGMLFNCLERDDFKFEPKEIQAAWQAYLLDSYETINPSSGTYEYFLAVCRGSS